MPSVRTSPAVDTRPITISVTNALNLAVTYLVLMWLLEVMGGDIWFANLLYQLQGGQWLLKNHWLMQGVLHKDARLVNYIFCTAVLLLTLYWQLNKKRYAAFARAGAALFISLICSFAIVAILKAITNISCPWDLSLFGGSEPYIGLFEHKPAELGIKQCFPAGHASIGYAWVALYFFLQVLKPQWRKAGLSAGIMLGLLFGLVQQLRGAHFLSHDLTTALICWFSAQLIFGLFYQPTKTLAEQQLLATDNAG